MFARFRGDRFARIVVSVNDCFRPITHEGIHARVREMKREGLRMSMLAWMQLLADNPHMDGFVEFSNVEFNYALMVY